MRTRIMCKGGKQGQTWLSIYYNSNNNVAASCQIQYSRLVDVGSVLL